MDNNDPLERLTITRIMHVVGIGEGRAGRIMTYLLNTIGIPALAVAFDDGPPGQREETRGGASRRSRRPIHWWDPAGGLRVLTESRMILDDILARTRGRTLQVDLTPLLVDPETLRGVTGIEETIIEDTVRENVRQATLLTFTLQPMRATETGTATLGWDLPHALGELDQGNESPVTQDEMQRTLHVTRLPSRSVRDFITMNLGQQFLRGTAPLEGVLRDLLNNRYPDLGVHRVVLRPNSMGSWAVEEGMWIVLSDDDGMGADRAEEVVTRAQLNPDDPNRIEPLAVTIRGTTTVIREFTIATMLQRHETLEWESVETRRRPARAPAPINEATLATTSPARAMQRSSPGTKDRSQSTTTMVISPSRGRGRGAGHANYRPDNLGGGSTERASSGQAPMGRGAWGRGAARSLAFPEQSSARGTSAQAAAYNPNSMLQGRQDGGLQAREDTVSLRVRMEMQAQEGRLTSALTEAIRGAMQETARMMAEQREKDRELINTLLAGQHSLLGKLDGSVNSPTRKKRNEDRGPAASGRRGTREGGEDSTEDDRDERQGAAGGGGGF